MEENRNVHEILVGKSEEMRVIRRPRNICEDRIEVDIGLVGREGVEGVRRDRVRE
jgi:hypothetical protein